MIQLALILTNYLMFIETSKTAFSPCGKFIVAHVTDQSPEIIPVPEHLLDRNSVTMAEREDSGLITRLAQNGKSSSAAIFPLPAEAGQLISKHQEIYNESQGSLDKISVGGGNAVTIKSWSTNRTKSPLKGSLEIMKIPDIPGLSTNIIMPSVQDEAVRIFIDQKARDYYPIVASADVHYPIFVDRHKSAIRHYVDPGHNPERTGTNRMTGLSKLMSLESAPPESNSELFPAKRQESGTEDITDVVTSLEQLYMLGYL